MSNEKIEVLLLSLFFVLSLSACAEKLVGETLKNIFNKNSTESMLSMEDEPDDDPEGLMILGHIISDMSVFDDMESSVEMKIDSVSD